MSDWRVVVIVVGLLVAIPIVFVGGYLLGRRDGDSEATKYYLSLRRK